MIVAQMICPTTKITRSYVSGPFSRLSTCTYPKVTADPAIAFRWEYACRNMVSTTPRNTISSKTLPTAVMGLAPI